MKYNILHSYIYICLLPISSQPVTLAVGEVYDNPFKDNSDNFAHSYEP